jgi:hypothetical protein
MIWELQLSGSNRSELQHAVEIRSDSTKNKPCIKANQRMTAISLEVMYYLNTELILLVAAD